MICDRGIFGNTHFGWSTVMNQSGRYFDTFAFWTQLHIHMLLDFFQIPFIKFFYQHQTQVRLSRTTQTGRQNGCYRGTSMLFLDLDFHTWQDQNNAEARALVEVVQGDNQAIVMGDINSSPDLPASDVQHSMEGE